MHYKIEFNICCQKIKFDLKYFIFTMQLEIICLKNEGFK